MSKRPLGYLGGDIMSFGSNLARQYEYDKFKELNLPVDVYSPVQNKSINDKSAMTEEENNHLAEKIVAADIERLWNSDFVVMEPSQNAIGSMTEVGCMYGWKYMAEHLQKIDNLDDMKKEIDRILNKDIYCHYFDIRTNHLNEKDWRRSFSINQFLYGVILYIEKSGDFETFEDIMKQLKTKYGEEKTNE